VSPVGEGIAFSVEWIFTRTASQATPLSYRTFSFRCSSEAFYENNQREPLADEEQEAEPMSYEAYCNMFDPCGLAFI
jgi:hypothetical protein